MDRFFGLVLFCFLKVAHTVRVGWGLEESGVTFSRSSGPGLRTSFQPSASS